MARRGSLADARSPSLVMFAQTRGPAALRVPSRAPFDLNLTLAYPRGEECRDFRRGVRLGLSVTNLYQGGLSGSDKRGAPVRWGARTCRETIA
jgi:hypothetical protein